MLNSVQAPWNQHGHVAIDGVPCVNLLLTLSMKLLLQRNQANSNWWAARFEVLLHVLVASRVKL